jgi:hypothetical protein
MPGAARPPTVRPGEALALVAALDPLVEEAVPPLHVGI